MWRDILIILGTGLTVIMFLQLNSRRLSKYAQVAKVEITKRNRLQKFLLIFMIVITPAFIVTVIWRFETLGLMWLLVFIAMLFLLWGYALIDVWKLKLSERGKKVTDVVRAIIYLAFLSLVITNSILSGGDIPLWQKLAPFLGGTAGGVGIHYLNEYVNKKLEGRRSSKEGNK
jgi:hypothetical protein